MKALISYTSNTILDKNRPYIGGERWFGIFDATALMISPQASENLHILMPPALINICSFREISIFEMTALISCTSNTMLDINRPFIFGERWFGIFATTAALMFSPQQAPRFYKPS